MTYFEIAKRKKHFHNTNIHWHLPTFHLCNYPAPKTHPYPPALGSSAGPLRERPPKCWWSPPESGDCVLKCQWNSLIGWQNNVWYSNSSVLVIWFSLGPCSRVLSDVLHVVSPKSTNCISFRRVQSVQSTCPPWWGNSHISPDKRGVKTFRPEPGRSRKLKSMDFWYYPRCHVCSSHKMPIASKSPEKMCRPQNSQCMSRIPGAGFGTCQQWFCPSHNFWFAIWHMCLPSNSAETSHGQCHACHARQDAERGPLKGRSGLPFKGIERLFSPILPMQRKLGGKWDRNVVGACWDFFKLSIKGWVGIFSRSYTQQLLLFWTAWDTRWRDLTNRRPFG